ncbi:MAG TPA: aspartyl/asparaginyl beta-hydroxylase domain-containing protein, partial [Allosphingosinicella sp.]
FDDTIEHEAWNRSDQLRAILIFDVWNPYITEVERGLLRRFYQVAAAANGGSEAAIGVSD